ncbi:uncharacterized protein with HEPN domain [Pseudomonas psychrotolerans]|uniref:Uncharacterized protein with HEPN domain n=2 Tax=Pseudomonas oryzihabitans TaxID=47885 RepID=A0AAJ2BLD9_9PSED|nr:DUF86 domain-containing protein [Pseudomonas psychrotolerans]MDR6233391.1 uncharacterized protein with HEPN domain [Pseudomonas psychrotolerans]MDR6357581.1 uncharacterized protein with HEPN domain [Pseudomonas psychrotolerans]
MNRVADYLAHMQQAATEALSFIEGLAREDFLEDRRTQQAVVMSLIIIGEAATKIMATDEAFILEHPHIPWRSMRGIRNRIAHGYFDINLEVVWETVVTALPELLEQLQSLQRKTDT